MNPRLKVTNYGEPHWRDHAKWALSANRIPIFQRITYASIMVFQLSFLSENLLNRWLYAVADVGGGMGGMHPPHQPKSYDFGRKISLYFE